MSYHTKRVLKCLNSHFMTVAGGGKSVYFTNILVSRSDLAKKVSNNFRGRDSSGYRFFSERHPEKRGQKVRLLHFTNLLSPGEEKLTAVISRPRSGSLPFF